MISNINLKENEYDLEDVQKKNEKLIIEKKAPIFLNMKVSKMKIIKQPPQFLQPHQIFRTNFDCVFSFKSNTSANDNYSFFKKILKKNFIKKKNKFDSFEIEMMDYDDTYVDQKLLIDRLESVNNIYAKNIADILKQSCLFQQNYFSEYENTEEYLNFIKKIEIAKNNRKGIPYMIACSKYSPKKQGFTIYKLNYSPKFIEIIYKGNLSELYKDCVETVNKFPFLGYLFEYNNYEGILDFFLSLTNLENESKLPNFRVELTKDGVNTVRAKTSFIPIVLKNPKDSNEILEIAIIQSFKCFEPQKNLCMNKNLKFDELNNIFEKKNDDLENIYYENAMEKNNIEFFQRYYT